jgi:hypothetical protein
MIAMHDACHSGFEDRTNSTSERKSQVLHAAALQDERAEAFLHVHVSTLFHFCIVVDKRIFSSYDIDEYGCLHVIILKLMEKIHF